MGGRPVRSRGTSRFPDIAPNDRSHGLTGHVPLESAENRQILHPHIVPGDIWRREPAERIGGSTGRDLTIARGDIWEPQRSR